MIHRIVTSKMSVLLVELYFLYIFSAFNGDCTILTKQPYNRSDLFFFLESEDYDSFLLLSSAIIDKSLLVKKLLESDCKVALISYPRGWGKTMNLDMTRIFVNLEVNDKGVVRPLNETLTYRLFMKGEIMQLNGELNSVLDKPYLVSKEADFCKKYLGKFPSIYLNFDKVGGEFDMIMNDVKFLIRELYQKHDYLIDVYEGIIESPQSSKKQRKNAQQSLDGFIHYYKGTSNLDDLIKSVQYLSDLLYDHYKKPSYVFIDNYEMPFKYMMETWSVPDKDLHKYLDFFCKFVARTFESSNHVKQGFVTCELKLLADVIFTQIQKFICYDNSNNELNDFYGLRYDEVVELYDHYATPESFRRKGHQYFNGYGISLDPTKRIYNTLALVAYLHRQYYLDCFSTDPEKIYDIFECFFKIKSFKKIIVSMIKGDDVEIPKATLGNLTITLGEYENMKKFLVPDHDSVDHKIIIRTAFKFFYSHGYLSLQEKSSTNSRLVMNDTDMVIPPPIGNETIVLRVASEEVSRDLDIQITYPPSGTIYSPNMSHDSDSLGL